MCSGSRNAAERRAFAAFETWPCWAFDGFTVIGIGMSFLQPLSLLSSTPKAAEHHGFARSRLSRDGTSTSRGPPAGGLAPARVRQERGQRRRPPPIVFKIIGRAAIGATTTASNLTFLVAVWRATREMSSETEAWRCDLESGGRVPEEEGGEPQLPIGKTPCRMPGVIQYWTAQR